MHPPQKPKTRKQGSAGRIRKYARGKKTKPDIETEVVGYVPAAARTAGEPTINVPRAAAQHAVHLLGLEPGSGPLPNIAAQVHYPLRRRSLRELADDGGGGVFERIAGKPLIPIFILT